MGRRRNRVSLSQSAARFEARHLCSAVPIGDGDLDRGRDPGPVHTGRLAPAGPNAIFPVSSRLDRSSAALNGQDMHFGQFAVGSLHLGSQQNENARAVARTR